MKIINNNFTMQNLIYSVLIILFLPFTSQSQGIVQMQRDYDATKARIASTKVDISYLSVDQKSVDNLKSSFYKKLHELDSALTVTKNYKQAGQKLDELIRRFYDDPGTICIQRNYNDFIEAESLRKELVKDKIITITEFEEWKKKVLDTYKSLNGANYNYKTGTCNSMSDILLNIND